MILEMIPKLKRLYTHRSTALISVHASPWKHRYWMIAKNAKNKIVDWFLSPELSIEEINISINQARKELRA